jgi:succinoglycan biosynthesis protein ExoW
MPNNKIAVVIPFFQREAGLLRRAIDSILAQAITEMPLIIVVDDGSPVRPEPELSDIIARHQIIIVRQANRGVAAARNRALDELPNSTEIVAFLDSDDWWSPGHLQKLTIAFDAGADFYFCNYKRGVGAVTIFELCAPDLLSVPPFCADQNIAWLEDDLLDRVVGNSPLAPSTCAYRVMKSPHVRFDPRFRRACEDRKFFAELSLHLQRIAFSRDCDVNYGEGVNIFGNAVWGTIEGVERVLDTMRFHRDLKVRFPLSERQHLWNEAALVALDSEFAEHLIVTSFKSRRVPATLAFEYLRLRPSMPRVLGRVAAKLFWQKLRSLPLA